MPLARRVGIALGVVDRPTPGVLKIHREAVPLTGGFAVITATLIATAASDAGRPSVVGALVIALLVGAFDDVHPSSPGVRVVGLALAGGVVAVGSLPSTTPVVTLVASLVFVLACANAVNLVDGQDGLAGGLAAIGAAGMAVAGTATDAAVATALGATLTAALVPFLLWNRPPARVFLGNAGAYAVGTALAIQATSLLTVASWRGWSAAALCLAVPAFEVVSTVVRRVVFRLPLAEGDRSHAYDILAKRTGRTRSTVALCLAQALAAAAGATLMWVSDVVAATIVGVVAAIALVAIASTLRAARPSAAGASG